MSGIEQREILRFRHEGSVCEIQARLTNSSLELKFQLLQTIYTSSVSQDESQVNSMTVSHKWPVIPESVTSAKPDPAA